MHLQCFRMIPPPDNMSPIYLHLSLQGCNHRAKRSHSSRCDGKRVTGSWALKASLPNPPLILCLIQTHRDLSFNTLKRDFSHLNKNAMKSTA